jgi:hypothetical protein
VAKCLVKSNKRDIQRTILSYIYIYNYKRIPGNTLFYSRLLQDLPPIFYRHSDSKRDINLDDGQTLVCQFEIECLNRCKNMRKLTWTFHETSTLKK